MVILNNLGVGVILGDGYLEIRGSLGYEKGILALADAIGLDLTKLTSATDYNASNDIDVVLGSILDVVLALVDGIAAGPVEFIAEHLAGLLYFVAADNVAVLVDNIIALVWGLLAVVEPITGKTDKFIESLLGVNLDNYITLDGLLGLINGLLEGKVDLVITKDMLVSLVAAIGENKDEYLYTPVKGSEAFFVSGLLTFAVEEILPIFEDKTNENAIINQVIKYLSAEGAVAGVVTFLNGLTNKEIIEFIAIEDPEVALAKLNVIYGDSEKGHSVTKAQADKALENLDALLAEILPMLGVLEDGETLASFVSGLLLNDKMLNTIVGLLAGVFAGLNADIMNIIDIVGDALGQEIDLSVANYKKDADLAEFFGAATTWSEVAAQYIKYEYTYTVPATADKEAVTKTAYDVEGAQFIVVDGKTYDLAFFAYKAKEAKE